MNKTSLALLAVCTVAGSASAQLKGIPAPKADVGGYFPPIGGTSALVAGGSNDCSTASVNDAIVGNGTFAVTTVGATNGTPDATGCVNTQQDVWFFWTSTITGTATVSTCGTGITADTVLTVWPNNAAGACPTGTTALGCADDSCGVQSQVQFPAVAGTSYFFQLGAFGTTTTYSGNFTVNVSVPPANDACATPTAIAGPGTYPIDTTVATTGTEGQAEALCNFFAQPGLAKDVWFTYTATANGTAELTTCGLITGPDSKVAIYDGAGCPAAAAIACNDDDATPCAAPNGFNSRVSWTIVCGQTYTIQLGSYPVTANSIVGNFAITETGTACGPAGFCFGDGSGTACPCGNAGAAGNGCANSLNPNGANLAQTGTASIAADTVSLNGTGMPDSSCLYFQGTSQSAGGAGVVFGDGLRCAGGTVIRLGTKTNVAGASSYPVGGDLTVSVRGSCVAGDIRTYQAWYRNAAAFCTASTFNLTNGVQITWAP